MSRPGMGPDTKGGQSEGMPSDTAPDAVRTIKRADTIQRLGAVIGDLLVIAAFAGLRYSRPNRRAGAQALLRPPA